MILIGDKFIELAGTDTYEIILQGNYILHKACVMIGNEKSETFELISFDCESNRAEMRFYNAKGENGVMTGKIQNNNFEIIGNGMKIHWKHQQ